MNPIGLKKKICMFVDRLFKIDRRAEYGLMDKTAYLAPDTILFNKKNPNKNFVFLFGTLPVFSFHRSWSRCRFFIQLSSSLMMVSSILCGV